MTPPESPGRLSIRCNTADAPGVCKGEGGKGVYPSPDDDSDGRARPAHEARYGLDIVRSPVLSGPVLKHSEFGCIV